MNAIFNNKQLCSKIKGFIQIGACIGEEIPYWNKLQIQNQVYIEPIPEIFAQLVENIKLQEFKPNVKAINCAVGKRDEIKDFFISKGSYCSSSLLQFDLNATKYGDTLQSIGSIKVPVKTLNTIWKEHNLNYNDYNLLYVDAQGCEGLIVKGGEEIIRNIDFFFVEVNIIPLYEEVMLWNEFNKYVSSLGQLLVDLRNLEGSQGTQKEALFINKNFKW